MKNPLVNLLTKDERRILGYLCVILICGMLIKSTGISLIYAEKTVENQTSLTQAVERDTVIKIDIRTASSEELELLPGIGPKRAETILAYRAGKQFDSPQELLNIKGIGAKTYLKMQPMLLAFGKTGSGVADKDKLKALNSPDVLEEESSEQIGKQGLDGTDSSVKKAQSEMKSGADNNQGIIHLNTASREDFMSLTGIGEKKADAILAYRKQIGRFTSIEQLMDVPGIGPKTLEKNRNRLSL
jgi:competence protein ComEA